MNVQSSGIVTKVQGSSEMLYILLRFENSSRQYIFTSYNNSVTLEGYNHSRVLFLQPSGSSSSSSGAVSSEVLAQLSKLESEQEQLLSKFSLFLSLSQFEEFKDGLDFSLSKYILYSSANDRLTTTKQFVSTKNFVMFSTGSEVEQSGGMDSGLLETYLTYNLGGWKLALSFLPDWIDGFEPITGWDDIENIPLWITAEKPTYSYDEVGAAALEHTHDFFSYIWFDEEEDVLCSDKSLVLGGNLVLFSTGEDVELGSVGFDLEQLKEVLTTNSQGWTLSLSFLPSWIGDSAPTVSWSEIEGVPSWIGSAAPVISWSEIEGVPSWIGSAKPSYSYSEVGAAAEAHTHDLLSYLEYDEQGEVVRSSSSIVVDGTLVLFATGGEVEEDSGLSSGFDLEQLEQIFTSNSEGWTLSLSFLPSWIGDSAPTVSWSEIEGVPSWIGSAAPAVSWDDVSGKPSWLTAEQLSVSWYSIDDRPSWIGSVKPSYSYSEVGAAAEAHTHDLLAYLHYDEQNEVVRCSPSLTVGGNLVLFSSSVASIEEGDSSSEFDLERLEEILTSNSEGWTLSLSFLPSWITDSKPTTLWSELEGVPSWIGSSAPVVSWSDVTSKPSWITDSKPTTLWSELEGVPSWIGSSAPVVSWSDITFKPSWIGSVKPSYSYSEVGAAAQEHTHTLALLGAAADDHSHLLFSYLSYDEEIDGLYTSKQIVTQSGLVMFSTQ